jgi:hypothetical protein
MTPTAIERTARAAQKITPPMSVPVSARRAGAGGVESVEGDPVRILESVPTGAGVPLGCGEAEGDLLGSGVDVGEVVSLGVGDGEGSLVAGVVVVGVGAGDVGTGSVATGLGVDGVPPRQTYGSNEFSPGIPSSCR